MNVYLDAIIGGCLVPQNVPMRMLVENLSPSRIPTKSRVQPEETSKLNEWKGSRTAKEVEGLYDSIGRKWLVGS